MSKQTEQTRRRNGEGSVYQLENGRWVGKLQLGKKANGKPIRKTFSGKTEAEVKKKIKEFNKEKDKYLEKNAIALSFEEYSKDWLYNFKRNQVKPSSFDRLESTIKHHLIPEIGFHKVSSIEKKDIQSLINKKFDSGLSHSSIKKIYDACNSIFEHALTGELKNNPMNGVIMPSIKKFDKKDMKYFNEKEIGMFETEATRTYRTGRQVYNNGHAFILMLNTGVREGEVLGIDKNKDIDLENNTLTIRRNVVTVKERDKKDPERIIGYNTKIQNSAKTDAGSRIIPLNKKAREAIEYLIENPNSENKDFLVSSEKGEALTPSSLSKTYKRILFAAGLDDCGTHTLRHTFASRLFKNGIDVKIVSELLGHANVSITYNTYIHLIKEQKVKAIQSLDF